MDFCRWSMESNSRRMARMRGRILAWLNRASKLTGRSWSLELMYLQMDSTLKAAADQWVEVDALNPKWSLKLPKRMVVNLSETSNP